MQFKKVMLVVLIPKRYLKEIRNIIFEENGGVMGNYNCCAIYSKVDSTFKPNNNANPFIGKSNKLKKVKEIKLEVICDENIVSNVIKKIKMVHPYEEPGIVIYSLLDL